MFNLPPFVHQHLEGHSPLDHIKFSPFLAQLIVTRRCNLKCGYCNEYDHTSDPIPAEVLRARIDKLKALGAMAIEFSGGEPLLNPDIFDLIRYARNIGVPSVQMISNATLFTEEVVDKLNDAGLEHLQISVDGVKPNDVTVKVLDRLRDKLEMVSKKAKFKVVMSGVIGSAPAEEVLEVIHFAIDHGFQPRVLLLHDGNGQLKLSEENMKLYEEVRKLMGERFKDSHDYRTKLMETGEAPFKCRAGSRYLYIDEFGLVHWCSQQRKLFSKPLDEYTFADCEEQFYKPKSMCCAHCTVGCARSCSKLDEWRKQ